MIGKEQIISPYLSYNRSFNPETSAIDKKSDENSLTITA